jgi:hypothetical protein
MKLNRYALIGSLLALLACAPAARAQFFGPLGGPFAPSYGGLYGGYPRGGYGGLFGGPGYYPGGPGYAPYGGFGPGYVNPYGATPYGATPYGPAPATGLTQSRQAGQGLADPGSPNVTGHPTRFASYSGYFNSQGGSLSGRTPVSRTPAASANPANTTQAAIGTSRTPTGMTGSSRTPRR